MRGKRVIVECDHFGKATRHRPVSVLPPGHLAIRFLPRESPFGHTLRFDRSLDELAGPDGGRPIVPSRPISSRSSPASITFSVLSIPRHHFIPSASRSRRNAVKDP